MAQTGYTPILIYSSSTTTNAPSAGNLTNSTLGSELAINITDGKLFYKDNANAVQVIAWKTTPTTAGGTGLTSYTAGDMLYYASGTALSKLAIGTTGQWLGSSGTAPQWNSPAALTKTDDTNVTLTLGGSASTALLNAASLTLGWTGQLATSRGGTGLSSFTANAVLYASSTSALATSSNFVTDGTRIGLNTSVLGWFSTFKGIDFEGGSLVYQGTGASFLTQNAFLNTSVQWKYRVNGTAAYYTQNTSGEHVFFVAASGTAGNTITWTQAQTIKNNADISFDAGNLIQGTAAKGINFTANTGAAGMTSQLLNWYEEGTWTPTVTSGGGTITSYTSAGTYTRIGRSVTASLTVTITNVGTATGKAIVTLPFTSSSRQCVGSGRENQNTGNMLQIFTNASAANADVFTYNNTTPLATNNVLLLTVTYFV